MSFDIEFDAVSYTLLALIVGALIIPLFLYKDPDIHPAILTRQSAISAVRKEGESAVYRSQETPTGYPLITGLGLKNEDRPYTTRDGDLRDVWEIAKAGGNKILEVSGVRVEEHNFADVDTKIHVFGAYLSSMPKAQRIAVYLPNSIESLIASFTCHLYGLTLIPLPYSHRPLDDTDIPEILQKAKPDVLITSAGQLPLDSIRQSCGSQLQEVIYFVDEGSRHIDWTDDDDQPKTGKPLRITQWHDVVDKPASSSSFTNTPHTPPEKIDHSLPALISASENQRNNKIELYAFTHANLVSAIGAQIKSLSGPDRFVPSDVFLPLDTLDDVYTRVLLYAALASQSTIALTSVAGKEADIDKAAAPVEPTIIVASTQATERLHRAAEGSMIEFYHRIVHWFQTRTLAHGNIPTGNILTRFNSYDRPLLAYPSTNFQRKLRLFFVAENIGADTAIISSPDLNDLRIFLASKVVYALTVPGVAGAVCAHNANDYRVDWDIIRPSYKKKIPRTHAHFGPPLPSVEIVTRDWKNFTAGDEGGPRGEIVVSGPAVGGGNVSTAVLGRWRQDGCLEFFKA